MALDPPTKASDAPKAANGRRPTPAEPVIVAKFWKNRRHSESVRVSLTEYEQHCLIDVRVFCTGADGIDRPTTKGVSMSVRKLPELARALVKAEASARARGLIEHEEPAG